MITKLFPKEIQQKLDEVDKIEQELQQIKIVVMKYFDSHPLEKKDFIFNNLKGTWCSVYSSDELDKTLKEIRHEWTKEIQEFGLE
ncbi:hypothetical protein A3F08_00520 [Candidatus Berkelbacteria bacterium RIFCSPHIGHO2_12_FULL_36_9]|uniref:Uncharacterized protein n=1 Tax=Candidatus Berkelbacteria bacterium RIFCSPHIGHO2_12_FULL_36_9 TaxID=1797469 RepID=A0A1F5EEP8_9BACT|nr:MAG: hypothetical protein A3F08_00520 [Candidatus Berkelbacteria bacterium RIFCSPHIGHO2_12_FULL_36_9]